MEVSWLSLNGFPIYPNLQPGSNLYGLLYGPTTFLVQWPFLATLGPSVFASKLAGTICFLSALLLIARIYATSTLPARLWLPFAAAGAMCILSFGEIAYWTRSDPVVLVLVALAMFFSRYINLRGVVGVGICAGLCFSLKPHELLACVTAVTALLIDLNSTGTRLRAIAIGTAATLVGISLPFIVTHAQPLAYIEYLGYASHHPLSPRLFVINLTRCAVLIAPVIAAPWLVASSTKIIINKSFHFLLLSPPRLCSSHPS